MVKNKILILGSKPRAEFGEFDIAYCANAASSFYERRLSEGGGLIKSVISASELVSNQRVGNSEKDNWLANKIPMLVDNSKSVIILLHHDFFPEAISILNNSSFSG